MKHCLVYGFHGSVFLVFVPFRCSLTVKYYRFPLLELFKLEARFVLRPGQHVNNMEENTNYRSLQCNSLGQILKNKGIPHSNKPKRITSKPLWERWSLKFTTYWSKWFSRHLLEDRQSKVKRIRIHRTVPSWTGRKICELCHLCV